MKLYSFFTVLLLTSSCGRYPEPVNSAQQIKDAPADITMLSIRHLDLAAYKDLAKFHHVTRIDMSNPVSGSITDGHLVELVKHLTSEVKDINLAGNNSVTDQGVLAFLQTYPLAYLKLDGTSITNKSLHAANAKLTMKGVNIAGCEKISAAALRECLVSGTVGLSFSISHLAPAEQEALAREKWRVGEFSIYDEGKVPWSAELTQALKNKAAQGSTVYLCKRVGKKLICEPL